MLDSVSEAKDREDAVKDVLNKLKKLPCPCTVPDCPFKGLCTLCVRNHRADGTLPACCLPRIRERYDVEKYPDCRSPLLWMLIDNDEFKDLFSKLTPELQEKVKAGLTRLYFFSRDL